LSDVNGTLLANKSVTFSIGNNKWR
jgi:hypothetical protein